MMEISICRYGGRPRFSTVQPLTLKLLAMAANFTLQQVKNLLKQEFAPVNTKLDELSNQLDEIDSTVKFLNAKYDELLNKIKNTNENVTRHGSNIANIKVNIKRVEKLATDTSVEVEEIAQYLRRDCLEITRVMANEDCSAEAIVTSVGNLIRVPLQENDTSVAHPISTYKEDAPPKIIVKFTRRCVRDKFYSNRRNLARKKASKDLPKPQPVRSTQRIRSSKYPLLRLRIFWLVTN